MGDELIEAPFLALDSCCFFRSSSLFYSKSLSKSPFDRFFFKKSLKEFLKEPGT
jgi:hypothetical protein